MHVSEPVSRAAAEKGGMAPKLAAAFELEPSLALEEDGGGKILLRISCNRTGLVGSPKKPAGAGESWQVSPLVSISSSREKGVKRDAQRKQEINHADHNTQRPQPHWYSQPRHVAQTKLAVQRRPCLHRMPACCSEIDAMLAKMPSFLL